jgi:hypothetical protein
MSGPGAPEGGLPRLLAQLRDEEPGAIAALAEELVRQRLPPDRRPVAVAWATVDLERARWDSAHPAWVGAPPDDLLGGRAMRAGLAPLDLVLLEPATEGRLAAFLARFGEGACALYIEAANGAMPPDSTEAGVRSWPTALGRPGRLDGGSGRWGPFVILLRGPGSPPTRGRPPRPEPG